MPLYYNAGTSSPSIEPLPAVVILDDRHFAHLLDEVEHDMGEKFDRPAMLTDILKALRREESAQLELEYLCLDLCSHGAEIYINGINKVGETLHSLLHYLRLYRRGEMPYVLVKSTARGIILMRRDEYNRRIRQDLDQEAAHEAVRQTTKRVMRELKAMAGDTKVPQTRDDFVQAMRDMCFASWVACGHSPTEAPSKPAAPAPAPAAPASPLKEFIDSQIKLRKAAKAEKLKTPGMVQTPTMPSSQDKSK